MHFVIAGRVNCSQFAYATMIAQRLKDILPQFTYKKISKKTGDWEKWLFETCKNNEWYHMTSPIIWREVTMVNGKKYYIGNIAKFLDLCQDYYGFPRQLLSGEHFKKAEMEWFSHRVVSDHSEEVKIKAKQHLEYRCRQVCILGAASYATDVLIMELLHNPIQNREYGMEIRLYDEPIRARKLVSIALDAKHCLGYSGLGSCRVVNNLKEALYKIDLVIVLDSFPRKSNESLVKWLKRNRNAMCTLGIALNKHARKHCRVIIGSPSSQPICYNATVLASYAKKLHVRNIVAITQDLGRETLSHLSQKTSIPLKDMHCPPVWGFVGLNKFVDLRRTLQTYNYRVPGPHVSRRILQGTDELELRTLDPLLTDEDINKIFMNVEKHKIHLVPYLGRFSQLAKIAAITDLLKVWGLKQEDGNGEILSLGVYSDGTFNIPKGLYWSQPVILEKGFWKPFAKYPIPRQMDINLHSFFILALASLVQTQIKIRKYKEPKAKQLKKETRKFDVEKLKEKLTIPVVKTENQCLALLKQLAKEELNIDFERARLSTITEESVETPLEEVIPEQIYCECWKQETLKFRKIILDGSSTTEIEVDLIDNLSEPEWTVINPAELYVPKPSSEESLQKITKDGTPSTDSSSGTIMCDYEEQCRCLMPRGRTAENLYQTTVVKDQMQNNEPKDSEEKPIGMRKQVKFDHKEICREGKSKFHLKFYGTRDAIVDNEKRKNLLKRIEKYEREREDKAGDEIQDVTVSEYNNFDFFPQKFHVSIDDNFEIIGDINGLETFEEMRKAPMRDSKEGFNEIWTDMVTQTFQVLSSDSESRSTYLDTMSDSMREEAESIQQEKLALGDIFEEYKDRQEHIIGDGGLAYSSNLEVISEGENEDEELEDFKTLQQKVTVEEVEQKQDKGELLAFTKTNVLQDLEEIPSCCLCRCVLPEGVLGCICTAANEVKEMKEISEKVSCEKQLVLESMPSIIDEAIEEKVLGEVQEEKEKKIKEEEKCKERNIFKLPPESFLPFSPRPINKFTGSQRPPELCQNMIINQFKPGFPPEFNVLFEVVKKRVTEDILKEYEKQKGKDETVQIKPEEMNFELRESKEMLEDLYNTRIYKDKELKKNLQLKYLKWLDTVPDIRDELYYEMVVNEISDDENFPSEEFRDYFED